MSNRGVVGAGLALAFALGTGTAWTDQPPPLTLGDTRAQLLYTPVTPCRLIDTRVAGGALAPGVTRNFRVTGGGHEEQGGSSQGCGIPLGRATAAFINFVAVNPAGQGNLRAWAYSDPPGPIPGSSIINYAFIPDSGLNLANGIAVPICDPAHTTCPGFDIKVRADGNPTHLVANVLGFYERFPTEEVPGLAVPAGAIIIWDQSTECPAGYTRAGTLDGRFLRGASGPGGTGGAESHTHEMGHTHGMGSHTHGGTTANGGADHSHQTNGIDFFGEETQITGQDEVCLSQPKLIRCWSAPGTGDVIFQRAWGHNHGTGGASAFLHTHAFGTGGPSTNTTDGPAPGTSGAASHLPPYANVLFCRKN